MLFLRNLAARVFDRPEWARMSIAEHEAELAELEARHADELAARLKQVIAEADEEVRALRARLSAILSLPEAEGRGAQAWFLGAETSLSIEDIASALAASAPPRGEECPSLADDWRGRA